MARIFHVVSGLKVGGAEMVLLRLILSAAGQQHVHLVVALDPVGDMGVRFRDAGIELETFDFKRSPWSEWRRLMSTMRRWQPDIVQTWLYHADLIGGLAARLSGIRRVIWGIRTTDVTKGGSHSIAVVRWLCARLSYVVPNAIVCVAEASRRAHARIGYCANRMVVIPNGFDIDAWHADPGDVAELRRACGIGPCERVIGSLGRFNAAKDPQNFVQAAARIAQRHSSVRFMMVGRGCDESNTQLKGWLAQHQIDHRFSLLGERRDVATCLAAMDIFALHSSTEGFPNVLAEAMAMYRPCVTTDVGDAALVLGTTGWVVPAEDAPALAKALNEVILKSDDERAAIGRLARARVEQQYSMAVCGERFDAVYQNLMSST